MILSNEPSISMSEGCVFDIQRSSFVDGPGIRTTVFFKGCNLRCRWCHNPESWFIQPQLMYYENRCTHCNRCVAACPTGALRQSLYPDPALCKHCGLCESACPNSARKLCGKMMIDQVVFDLIRKDQPFYDTSGGGVTFSGGECLLQPEFLLALLQLCKEHHINTAVDTAGNVPYSKLAAILPFTDIFLYDIKCIDPALHQKITGADNALILENYQKLQSAVPDKLIVRIPVIPGHNATDEEMSRIAAFLRKYPPKKYELLPYHKMGEAKVAALQLDKVEIQPPSAEDMEHYRNIFEQ